jgi:tetratricopeptide (TPR) repeat protein
MMADNRRAVRDHIFISYRRDDASGASGRLYDWLRIAFGREHVFRDVHSIGAGKWRDQINDALARSAVCLAVIGPRWANADNLPRLHAKNDTVRHELAAALASQDLTLIPTLVEDTAVPRAADLPDVLRSLFDWNALAVTEHGWEDDTRRLIAKIAEVTKLSVGPDFETLLRSAGRVAELEQTSHLQADQIDALRGTVDDLRRKLATASSTNRPGLAAAFAALAQGDSLAAEDAFEREYDAQSRAAEEARRTRAEAARNVANLALLRDVAKAVSFYRKALAVEPEHAETACLLGDALMRLGDLKAAEGAFSQSLNVAIIAGDSWAAMAAQDGLGDVFRATGDLAAAHAAFAAALRLAEQLLLTDPANAQWLRDLSVIHIKIGDVLVAQGDGPGRSPPIAGASSSARRTPCAIRPTPSGSATSRTATTRSATR